MKRRCTDDLQRKEDVQQDRVQELFLARLFASLIRERRDGARFSAASIDALKGHARRVMNGDLEARVCTRVEFSWRGRRDWLVLRTDPAVGAVYRALEPDVDELWTNVA